MQIEQTVSFFTIKLYPTWKETTTEQIIPFSSKCYKTTSIKTEQTRKGLTVYYVKMPIKYNVRRSKVTANIPRENSCNIIIDTLVKPSHFFIKKGARGGLKYIT